MSTSTIRYHLTGAVTDDGRPVPGATITVQPSVVSAATPSVTTSADQTGLYALDFDAGPSFVSAPGSVSAESPGHDPAFYRLSNPFPERNASLNIHLHRIARITAGESTVLTVAPGDTLCGDEDQFRCRAVHVIAPDDGTMTFKAVPSPSVVANAGLYIMSGRIGLRCCALTTSVSVTAGAEIVANVGMFWTSTASQSFVLETSLLRP